MERRQWIETLDRHAEGMRAGSDLSASLLALTLPDDRAGLDGLLAVARRVQQALSREPRHAPRPAFVAQLKIQLLTAPRPVTGPLPDRRTLLWWAAGAGGVLSAAGLGFLAYKAIDNGISGIMAARAARPALSKAQPAP
jgi:hypothetical protein